MVLLWDGTRKPAWDTLTDQNACVNGKEISIASFSTVPFRDVDEYHMYKEMTDKFTEENGKRPLTYSDFIVLREMIEEKKKKQ